MKPDQERVRNLLTDTVTLLCKNGLQFSKELKVQGLLGITTDENDVFVVHINERFGDALGSTSVSIQPDVSSKQILEIAGVKQKVSSPSTQGRKRPAQNRSDNDSPPKKSASVLTKDTALSIKVKSEETEAEIFEVIDAGLNETSVDDDDRDAMRMTYSTPSGQLGEESSGGPSTVGETGTDQSQGQEQFLAFIKTQEAATNDVDGDDDDFGDQGWDNSALVQGGDSVEAAAGTSSTWTPRTPRTSGRHRKRNSRGADDMMIVPNMLPSEHQKMFLDQLHLPSPRRPRASTAKPHKCLLEGCDRTFFHWRSVRRHLRHDHFMPEDDVNELQRQHHAHAHTLQNFTCGGDQSDLDHGNEQSPFM